MNGENGQQPRKQNPNSLANLRPPIRPGEVRNPTGKNGIRPYTDAMKQTSEQPMPEHLRLAMNSKYKTHLFVALQNHPRFKLTEPNKIPDLYPKHVTWAQANAIRQHLAAVLEGNIQAAVECREAVEGRTTNRIEFVSKGDKLIELLDAFRAASGAPDLEDEAEQEAQTITLLPGNTTVTPTNGDAPPGNTDATPPSDKKPPDDPEGGSGNTGV